MSTKVQKWGNSLAVRLSKETVERLRIQEGSVVNIDSNTKQIVIKPEPRKETTLKDIVDGITLENRHEEVEFGKPVGKEVW
jgi:antitoxin MazE